MTVTIERLPERMYKQVIDAYKSGDKKTVLKLLKQHKVITCGTCANWATLKAWVDYAIESRIWTVNEKSA